MDQETVSKGKIKSRSKLFTYSLVLITLAFAILTYFAKQTPYFSFDLQATLAIQRFNPSWFDQLMKFTTDLGYYPSSVLIVIFFTAGLFLLSKRVESFLFIFSSIGVGVVSETLKNFISRERPSPDLVNQIVTHIRSDSFPSGHVLLFMATYGLLCYFIFTHIKRKILRLILCTAFLIPIILVGLSRIYLGDHWLSDVMGGYLLGALWLFFIIYLYRKLTNL